MKKILALILVLLTFTCFSCAKQDDYKLSVIAPSGAPGIALAELAHDEKDNYNIELNKTADVLKASFTAKEADVIIAPINLGANLYKANEAYQLASVITWGNLYFASQKENLSLTDLNQADVLLFGKGTINDVIVQYILKEKGITLGEGTTYLASTQLTNQQLLSNPNAIALVAEPALSTAMSKKNISILSVQELYKEVSGSNSYPQAGCFVKKTTVEDHKKVVDDFLNKLEASSKACNEKTTTIAEYAVELELASDAKVLEKAIPNSNISYVKGIEAKADIEKMVALNPKLFGGANPVEQFYYA